jgi:two-component system sensor histidine kinase/response regulator
MIDFSNHREPPSVVLVIDDEPKNIQVVGSLLLKHGHEIIAANSGEEALQKLESLKPDLILLDVMMPGMTGMELCQILQANPETRDTPIIFLSACTDKNSVIEGLGHGAVDYMTKPFHGPELLSRVELHTKLRRTLKRLDDSIAEQKRLMEIVAHNLKTPLSSIHLATTMLAERSSGTDQRGDLLLQSIKEAASRAFEIVSSLLLTSELENVMATIHSHPLCLQEIAAETTRNFEQHFQSKSIHFHFQSSHPTIRISADPRSLRCCLENLISNAIKFSPVGGNVAIDIGVCGDHGKFEISDQGPGVLPEEQNLLFRKFSRLSARPTAGEASTGLGLHIVQQLVTAMNGTVQYQNGSLGGACFSLMLPRVPEP